MRAVPDYEFKNGRQGPDSRYDWEKLCDGTKWELVAGHDFDCKMSTMRQMFIGHCKRRKIGFRTEVNKEGNLVVWAVLPLKEQAAQPPAQAQKPVSLPDMPERSDEDAEQPASDAG